MAEWGNNSAHKYKNRLAIRHSVCYNGNRKRNTVIRRRSSAGQSARFTSVRSWVRAPSSPPKIKRAQRARFIFAGSTPCDVPHRQRRLRFALCGRILSPIFRNNSWGLLKYTVPYGIICYKMTHVCTSCLSVARDNRRWYTSVIRVSRRVGRRLWTKRQKAYSKNL